MFGCENGTGKKRHRCEIDLDTVKKLYRVEVISQQAVVIARFMRAIQFVSVRKMDHPDPSRKLRAG